MKPIVQISLDVTDINEALSTAEMAMRGEMSGSHGVLVRQALAHLGYPI